MTAEDGWKRKCERLQIERDAVVENRDLTALERDDARFVARALWDFIQEGCFLDDIEMGEPDTPEWELWVKKHIVQDLVERNPWVKEQE